MASTVGADDLRPLHSEGAISVSHYGAWNLLEEGGPAAAALELAVVVVERGIAAGAVEDALVRVL